MQPLYKNKEHIWHFKKYIAGTYSAHTKLKSPRFEGFSLSNFSAIRENIKRTEDILLYIAQYIRNLNANLAITRNSESI